MPKPTPRDMPGANTGTVVDADDDQDQRSAEQQQPDDDDDGGDDAGQQQSGGDDGEVDLASLPEPVRNEIERLRRIHKEERRWERIAKRNKEDAEQYRRNKERLAKIDQQEAANRSEAENLRLELERERQARTAAETRELRGRIAAEFGVPVRAVVGDTEDEMRDAAQEYNDVITAGIEAQLRARNIGPAAPASAVTSSSKPNDNKQLHQSDLDGMSRKDILKAYRSGQLDEALGRSK